MSILISMWGCIFLIIKHFFNTSFKRKKLIPLFHIQFAFQFKFGIFDKFVYIIN
jgi:hypothetical protein